MYGLVTTNKSIIEGPNRPWDWPEDRAKKERKYVFCLDLKGPLLHFKLHIGGPKWSWAQVVLGPSGPGPK